MGILEFGTGGVATAVAIILAKLIYSKWFSDERRTPEYNGTSSRSKHATSNELDELGKLVELRFSQVHDDLKAIKTALYETRDTGRWLREAHDQRDGDGSFRWWNKHSVEQLITATHGKVDKVLDAVRNRSGDDWNVTGDG